jgi:putative methylase
VRRRTLERRLERLEGFADPDPAREQYATPADVAAHLVHLAATRGDLGWVLDLGCGTGLLALGAALAGADRVVGVELDPGALAVAGANTDRLYSGPEPHPASASAPAWVRGDATRPPVTGRWTVLSNPPFGAQRGNEHADRAFLAAAADLADVSYTVHNAGSREFVASFAADNGGRVTAGFAVELALPRQFAFHTAEKATVDAEAYRIEWNGDEG